jgi:hypothetical protein
MHCSGVKLVPEWLGLTVVYLSQLNGNRQIIKHRRTYFVNGDPVCNNRDEARSVSCFRCFSEPCCDVQYNVGVERQHYVCEQ